MQSYFLHDTATLGFIVIGEAAKNLDAKLTQGHPHINWKGVAGFRDILVHQYRRTRLDLVWRVAQEDLPGLKSAIIDMLESLDGSGTVE